MLVTDYAGPGLPADRAPSRAPDGTASMASRSSASCCVPLPGIGLLSGPFKAYLVARMGCDCKVCLSAFVQPASDGPGPAAVSACQVFRRGFAALTAPGAQLALE